MYQDPQAKAIVGVVKDNKGEITAYKLENDEIIMKEQAVIMAKQGAIKGVEICTSKTGEKFLRTYPDGTAKNNLESMPLVQEED